MSGNDNYIEETSPLFRLLRTEAFRFVLIRYNHYDLIRRLKADLKARFPERPQYSIKADTSSYEELMRDINAVGRGFIFIENFRQVFHPEKRLFAGLNQRRDKLAQKPIAIFALFEPPASPTFAREVMEKMPDLWSFRSMLLDLEMELPRQSTSMFSADKQVNISTLGGHNQAEKEQELERLLRALSNIPENNTSLRKNQYAQIVQILEDLGYYDRALQALAEQESLETGENEKTLLLLKKGDLLLNIGDFLAAKAVFERGVAYFEQKSRELADTPDIKNNLADFYKKLGDTQGALGNLEAALSLFEQYNAIEKTLHESHPQKAEFKNNLAISYSRLGGTQRALGNLESALSYFEQYNALEKELYESYPQNVEYKNNLAISYAKLGETHRALGNLEAALSYFEQYNALEKELHESYPQNLQFKNNLAISYEELGETHRLLGNLEAALNYFEERSRLGKELYESYPQNVSFKNGLAISYEKLGETHSSLGNLEAALKYFEEDFFLTKELHESYPQNVHFKNGLAVSYYKLAEFYRDHREDKAQAAAYFQQACEHWKALSEAFPAYQQFGRHYKKVQQVIEELQE